MIAILAALAASYPPDEGEIKKKFRATIRAKRLLGASFVVAALIALLGFLIVSHLPLDTLAPAVTGAIGLILFLFAPLILVIGNLS